MVDWNWVGRIDSFLRSSEGPRDPRHKTVPRGLDVAAEVQRYHRAIGQEHVSWPERVRLMPNSRRTTLISNTAHRDIVKQFSLKEDSWIAGTGK